MKTPLDTEPTQNKTLKVRDALRGCYRKGDDTRDRILNAALTVYGEAPFNSVTTRQIAKAAAVSLPILQFYFVNEEGLYRACAEAIVEKYRRHTSGATSEARSAVNDNCESATARVT